MGGLILIISNYIKIFMHSIGVEPTSLTLLEWAFTINITGAGKNIGLLGLEPRIPDET